MTNTELDSLYNETLRHKEEVGGGTVPYKYRDLLYTLLRLKRPAVAIDIGTALGYTAICLKDAGAQKVITIEMNEDHARLAFENFNTYNFTDKEIELQITNAEEFIETYQKEIECIFIDGYKPQIDLISKIEKKLAKNALLIIANIWDFEKSDVVIHIQKQNRYDTFFHGDTLVCVVRL